MYCKNCGNQIDEKAVICTKCGCLTDNGEMFKSQQSNQPMQNERQSTSNSNGLGLAAKILMIISTVFLGFYIIPLAWMLPMTISLSRKLKNNEPVGTGFKVCVLIFCNLIAGILLLCMKEEK